LADTGAACPVGCLGNDGVTIRIVWWPIGLHCAFVKCCTYSFLVKVNRLFIAKVSQVGNVVHASRVVLSFGPKLGTANGTPYM
jgi:hypothetical protein